MNEVAWLVTSAQDPLGSSRLDTFDLSRRACRAALSDKLDSDTANNAWARHVERVETWRDEPSEIRVLLDKTGDW